MHIGKFYDNNKNNRLGLNSFKLTTIKEVKGEKHKRIFFFFFIELQRKISLEFFGALSLFLPINAIKVRKTQKEKKNIAFSYFL